MAENESKKEEEKFDFTDEGEVLGYISLAQTSLNPAMLDALANDLEGNWCAANSLISSGDRGTPGSANDACP